MAYDPSSTHPNRLTAELLPTDRPADATGEQLEAMFVSPTTDISSFRLPNTQIVFHYDSAGNYQGYGYDANARGTDPAILSDADGRRFVKNGSGFIYGVGAFDFGASGNVQIDRNLAGTGSFDFSAVGSFDESSISGSGSFEFGGSATLQVTRNLAAAASFGFSATGTLIKTQRVSANGSFEFTGTATVDTAGFTRGFSIGFRS